MPTIEEAQQVLRELGLPPAQQNEMSALTLLALCGLSPMDKWSQAQRRGLTLTKGIMSFVAQVWKRNYAPNTRETFRRQVLHQFVQARIADYNPDHPALPTNSPRAHYALTEAALSVIRTFGTKRWPAAVRKFINEQGALLTIYQKKRVGNLVPVRLPGGKRLALSPGRHNQLQAAVIEQFAPRFAPGAHLLYLGDTALKNLFLDEQRLSSTLSIHDL